MTRGVIIVPRSPLLLPWKPHLEIRCLWLDAIHSSDQYRICYSPYVRSTAILTLTLCITLTLTLTLSLNALQLILIAPYEILDFPRLLVGSQAALIDHLSLSENDAGAGDGAAGTAYSLTPGTLREHLRLDSAAAAAVTLLPDPTAPHQYGSLYNILNR